MEDLNFSLDDSNQDHNTIQIQCSETESISNLEHEPINSPENFDKFLEEGEIIDSWEPESFEETISLSK